MLFTTPTPFSPAPSTPQSQFASEQPLGIGVSPAASPQPSSPLASPEPNEPFESTPNPQPPSGPRLHVPQQQQHNFPLEPMSLPQPQPPSQVHSVHWQAQMSSQSPAAYLYTTQPPHVQSGYHGAPHGGGTDSASAASSLTGASPSTSALASTAASLSSPTAIQPMMCLAPMYYWSPVFAQPVPLTVAPNSGAASTPDTDSLVLPPPQHATLTATTTQLQHQPTATPVASGSHSTRSGNTGAAMASPVPSPFHSTGYSPVTHGYYYVASPPQGYRPLHSMQNPYHQQSQSVPQQPLTTAAPTTMQLSAAFAPAQPYGSSISDACSSGMLSAEQAPQQYHYQPGSRRHPYSSVASVSGGGGSGCGYDYPPAALGYPRFASDAAPTGQSSDMTLGHSQSQQDTQATPAMAMASPTIMPLRDPNGAASALPPYDARGYSRGGFGGRGRPRGAFVRGGLLSRSAAQGHDRDHSRPRDEGNRTALPGLKHSYEAMIFVSDRSTPSPSASIIKLRDRSTSSPATSASPSNFPSNPNPNSVVTPDPPVSKTTPGPPPPPEALVAEPHNVVDALTVYPSTDIRAHRKLHLTSTLPKSPEALPKDNGTTALSCMLWCLNSNQSRRRGGDWVWPDVHVPCSSLLLLVLGTRSALLSMRTRDAELS